MPIKANPWPIGYIGALSCSDNGCLVGIHLSCREDGLFRRVLPRYILKVSGPYDEFVTKDMIISVIVDNGSNLPPRPVPMELQIDWVFGTEGISDDEDEVPVPTEPLPYDISDTEAISDDEDEVGKSVRVKTDRGAREGFVLFQEENIRAGRGGTYRWNDKDPCVFFYRNRASGEGFAVTIGWRLNRPCAHIEGFGKTAPPSQMLAGCSSSSKVHPREWAFKPLRKGVRVTVTATLDARRWTVSISVGRPKSAHRPVEQVSKLLTSEQHWDPVDPNPHDRSQLQRAPQGLPVDTEGTNPRTPVLPLSTTPPALVQASQVNCSILRALHAPTSTAIALVSPSRNCGG